MAADCLRHPTRQRPFGSRSGGFFFCHLMPYQAFEKASRIIDLGMAAKSRPSVSTSRPCAPPATLAGPQKDADRIAWEYAHWIWPVDRVRTIAADTNHPATFFCGGSRNFQKFLHLFDKVFE
jgi:hypothetical protein